MVSTHLLSASWVQRIEAIEQRCETGRVGAPLCEFAAGCRAVTLIRASGLESAVAAKAQDAARKRAHAFWDRIGFRLMREAIGPSWSTGRDS